MVRHMFRIETEVDKERRLLLRSLLQDANRAASPALRELHGTAAERETPLQVWALTPEGTLAGGLDAHTWAGWLHVNLLWVADQHRGAGLGSRLLTEAELRAREEHGCVSARVETWDFQAPGFYRQHGYDVVAVVPDYPPGAKEFTLTKRLG
ncbi:GNAT family N-acetyltransferase [Streptomyces sp. NPDC049813]|uniref:GNAT family N-acetyltransferase n=1 Tax=Streptomyces sp. NPDC049813 TaxID=3365597 RepID=UPI00378ED107